MRLNQPGESVVVVPSITPDATRSRRRGAGLRGALPLPAAAAAPAAAADDLRHLDAGRPAHHRVLPRAAAGRDPEPRTRPAAPRRRAGPLAAAAGRRSCSSARGSWRNPLPHPRPHALPPRAVQHDRLERDLALALGIPMYGADPRLLPTRAPRPAAAGCSREDGVAHPLGVEDLHDPDDVAMRWRRLRAARPGVDAALVKLNDGVSGRGNASVDLAGCRRRARRARRRRCAARPGDAARAPRHRPSTLPAELARGGGIVEERIGGRRVRSPSVQLRVTPLGEVELLSTHDQMLGGPAGRATWAAASRPTRPTPGDQREAVKVGSGWPSEGVLGRFAVDFVVVRDARRRRGRRTRSRSTCARAAPRIPS